MKKNNDKYWRIGIFAFAFLFGLICSAKTGNGKIALITCVFVPLLYIPYGISDWYRKKPKEPSEKPIKPSEKPIKAAEKPIKAAEKRPEPPKPAVTIAAVEKEKILILLGDRNGYGTGAWMRQTDKGFEMIVEYHAPNPFEHFGTSEIVPDEVIGQCSLQALRDWMYSQSTKAFHVDITVRELDYLRFLRECGAGNKTDSRQITNSDQTDDSLTDASPAPKTVEPYWVLLRQIGSAFSAADASTVTKIYRDPKTDMYYKTDINGYVLASLTREQAEGILQNRS